MDCIPTLMVTFFECLCFNTGNKVMFLDSKEVAHIRINVFPLFPFLASKF